MASNLEPKINRIATAVTSALSALTAKGVTVPEGANVESLAALIESIQAGGGGGDLSKTQYSKMTCGTITPSESQQSLTICHNLGEVPKLLLFFSEEVDDFYSCSTACLMYFHSYVFTDSNGIVWNNKYATGKGNASWSRVNEIKSHIIQGDHLTKLDLHNPGGITFIDAESAIISMQNRSAAFFILVLPVTYTWFAIA